MTREIKFRAWDKNNKKMDYNPMVDGNIVGFVSINNFYFQHDENIELMQYTGLKDKNGKPIFEGDILQASHGKKQVEYEAETGFFGRLIEGENPSYCEIIGNIYENPELLVSKQQ